MRRRFLDAFEATHTQVVVSGGADVGPVALRPGPDALWLEHFHLDPAVQGQGLGSAVLAHVLSGTGADRPVRLDVLVGSRAADLYARHGFRTTAADAVDVWMERPAR